MYKCTPKLDDYITILPEHLRIKLCRFRVSNYNLPIEKRRHDSVPKKDRLCILCNSSDIGDEFLYLFFVHISIEKENYICLEDFILGQINAYTFSKLFNCENRKTTKQLSRFVNYL